MNPNDKLCYRTKIRPLKRFQGNGVGQQQFSEKDLSDKTIFTTIRKEINDKIYMVRTYTIINQR